MPYVTQAADGYLWVTKSGLNLGFANGKGSTGVTGSGVKYVAGASDRNDRMAATGLFADGSRGDFRPTVPELRFEDQDRDGIQAEVLYGLIGTGNKLHDQEVAAEFYRIYNEWLSDFCGHARKRLVGLAAVPSYNVEAAVAEVRHVAKLGLGGIDFPV